MKRAPRGVTLLEGMIASMVLLTGMVGVLQGVYVASLQNSMANRHTRASIIAQELATAIEQQPRSRLVPTTGLFGTACSSTVPTGVANYTGDLTPVPTALTSLGFTAGASCYLDFDSLAANFRAMTPGYSAQDDATYQRMVAVYRHPSNSEVMYLGINVGWTDGGRVRIVKRFTAIYDTAVNQTNLEF